MRTVARIAVALLAFGALAACEPEATDRGGRDASSDGASSSTHHVKLRAGTHMVGTGFPEGGYRTTAPKSARCTWQGINVGHRASGTKTDRGKVVTVAPGKVVTATTSDYDEVVLRGPCVWRGTD